MSDKDYIKTIEKDNDRLQKENDRLKEEIESLKSQQVEENNSKEYDYESDSYEKALKGCADVMSKAQAWANTDSLREELNHYRKEYENHNKQLAKYKKKQVYDEWWSDYDEN